ncbi:hypothetical protein F5882DRAFT_505901 [Hyaloscypha sp. PMI_1271]|nr:hypothetical protein F5882DRAFT_505901 [Hyaloscypha sp. PMI_1271]
MTASHLSSTHMQASLQDAIPFRFALGLSLSALIPAGSRLWGCTRVPNLSRWHLLIYCLSLTGSVSLLAIVVSKVYERHHRPYLALILVNIIFLVLYEFLRSGSLVDLGKPAICCQQRNIHFYAFWLYLSYLGRAIPRYAALHIGAIDPMPFCTPLFNLHSTGSIILFFKPHNIFGFNESLPRYQFSTFPKRSNKDSQVALVPAQPNCDATDPLRQWEKGVLELLKSTQDQEIIRKICRLPFRDRNALQDMLSRRWNSELDLYLMSLRIKVKDHREEIFD